MPKSIKKLRHQLSTNPYALAAPIVSKASSLEDADTEGASGALSTSALSRGQRKRQERKQHVFGKLGKWEAPIVAAQREKKREQEAQRDREDGLLSELERTLKGTDSSADIKPAAASTVTSNKMKRDIALREAERMRLVQEHPAFVADPFAAMRTHIEQSLALKLQGQQIEVTGRAPGVPMHTAAPRGGGGGVGEARPQSKSHEKRLRQKAQSKMDV